MKKQRTQLTVLLILIVCALGALLLLRRSNEKAAQREEAENDDLVIDELAVSEITAFSYEQGGVKWSYDKEGDHWICQNDEQLKLDTDKIESLLDNVSSITASEQLTDVEDFAQYGLAAPSNTVTVTAGGETIIYFIGDYNSIISGYYVRKNDEATVYVVSGGIATAFSHEPQEYAAEEEAEGEAAGEAAE